MDTEGLERHGAELRRIAHAILGDAHLAEDMTQEALLVGLTHPPRRDGNRAAWLAAVVRNLSRMALRSDRRRRRRERSAPPRSPVAPAVNAVARAEAARRLSAAVADLDEPYRTAIVLRYYEELGPREIADRLGIPHETVRTRLRRGLARVRSRLEERDPRFRAGLLLLAGGLTMSKQAIVAAAVLVVAVVTAGVLTFSFSPLHQSPEEAGTAEPTARAPAPPVLVVPGRSQPKGLRPLVLRGTVENLDAGLPGEAVVHVAGGPSVEAAADGGFELEVSSLARRGDRIDHLEVLADHPAYMPAAVTVVVPGGDLARCEDLPPVRLDLFRAGVVVGRVVDESGAPVAEARVQLVQTDEGRRYRPSVVVESGDDGSFRLRGDRDGGWLVVADAVGLRPASAEAQMRVGGETEISPLVLRPGYAIRGRVRCPFPGVRLRVVVNRREGDPFGQGGDLCRVDGAAAVWKRAIEVGADGTFFLAGLAPGTHRVSIAGSTPATVHPDVGPTLGRWVEVPVSGDLELQLPLARLVVEIRGSSPDTRGTMSIDCGGTMARGFRGGEPVTAYVIAGSVCRISANAGGFQPSSREITAPGPGEETTIVMDLEPELPASALRVAVVGPDGPVARATFRLLVPGASGEEWTLKRTWRVMESEDGVFLLDGLAAGAARLEVVPGVRATWGGGFFLSVTREVDVPTGGTADVRFDAVPAGRLRLVVEDGGGESASTVDLRDGRGERVSVRIWEPAGENAVGGTDLVWPQAGPREVEPPLPPGNYRMRITTPGGRTRDREFSIDAGRTTELKVGLD